MTDDTATDAPSPRFLREPQRRTEMQTAAMFKQHDHKHSWIDIICDGLSGAAKKLAQTIDSGNGTSRMVAAVAVVVIGGIIIGVGGMAVSSAIALSSLQTQVSQGFTEIGKRLDDHDRKLDKISDRLDSLGQRGPPAPN